MPFTIPDGGRSIADGRAEEAGVEVVAVTSGGTEKFSEKRIKGEKSDSDYFLLQDDPRGNWLPSQFFPSLMQGYMFLVQLS